NVAPAPVISRPKAGVATTARSVAAPTSALSIARSLLSMNTQARVSRACCRFVTALERPAPRGNGTVIPPAYSCHNGSQHGGERASLQEVRCRAGIDPLARAGDGRTGGIADPARARRPAGGEPGAAR